MKTSNAYILRLAFVLGLVTYNIITGDLFSQSVAINSDGSPPDVNSILDLSNSNKGLLLPRMTNAQMNALVTPKKGMLIFNTDQGVMMMQHGTEFVPSWERSATTITTWNILGNGGTDPNIHFLGTTDAADLIFKTDNVEHVRLTAAGDLGIGGTPSDAKLCITKFYDNSSGKFINNYFTQKNITLFSGLDEFTHSGGSQIHVTSTNEHSSNVIKGEMITVYTADHANADSIIGLEVNMHNSSGGTIDKEYGIKVSDISPQHGTLNNTFGLYIGDMTNGTQTRQAYSVYSSDSNSRSYLAGKLGIGTDDPKSKLDVNGGVAIGSSYAGVTAAPSNGLIVEGNVGLGEDNPTSTLHVKGSLTFDDGTAGDDNKTLVFDPAGNARWEKPGNLKYEHQTIGANYNMGDDDYLIIADISAGITLQLPEAANNIGETIILICECSGCGMIPMGGGPKVRVERKTGSGDTFSGLSMLPGPMGVAGELSVGQMISLIAVGPNKWYPLASPGRF